MGACGSCSAEKDVVDTADVAIDDATGRAQSYTVKHGFSTVLGPLRKQDLRRVPAFLKVSPAAGAAMPAFLKA